MRLSVELKDFSTVVTNQKELINYVIGTLIAGVVESICIKTMLVVVSGKKYKYFAYYCFVIGLTAVVGNFVIKG